MEGFAPIIRGGGWVGEGRAAAAEVPFLSIIRHGVESEELHDLI